MLKNSGYFTYCCMGICRNPRCSRSLAQAWSEHKALLTPQTEMAFKAWACNKFSSQCINGYKRACNFKVRIPWRTTPFCLIETQRRPFTKVLVQVFMTFAELSHCLFEKSPDQQNLSHEFVLKEENRSLFLPNILFWVLVWFGHAVRSIIDNTF